MQVLNTKQLRYIDLSYNIVPAEGEIAPDDYARLVLQEGLIWPLKTYHSYVDDSVYQIVQMKTHLKTHTEAPYHLDMKGMALSDYPPETFFGRAVVFCFDAGADAIITREMIEAYDNGRLGKGDIVIVRSTWTKAMGGKKPEILKDAGQYFLDKGIKYFGMDESISIFRGGHDSTHDMYLKKGIPLLEMLINLDKLTQDVVFLIATPGLMKVKGIDSSTTQAVAIEGIEVR